MSAVGLSGTTIAAQLAAIIEDLLILVLLPLVGTRCALFTNPDVTTAVFILDLLWVWTFT